MEKCQRSPEDIKKYGELIEERMERMAKVRGLLALVSRTNGRNRVKFVNPDLNAPINISCAVMERRHPKWTRKNFVREFLKVELSEKKFEVAMGGRSEKTGRRLHIRCRVLVWGGFLVTSVHCRLQRLSFKVFVAGSECSVYASAGP